MKNVALLLCCILLLCNGCKYFKKSSSKKVETISADTLPTEESIDSAAYYSDIANANSASSTVSAQPVAQSKAVGGKYYMIVGCFTVSANADKYAEKLRGKGYDVTIIPGSDNFQMVAAKSYGNYRESISEIDKFRNDVTPNAWVYLKK
jgi:hypothetical protein